MPLKQLGQLGERESQLSRSLCVIEWHAQVERKHYFVEGGRSRGELQICGRDRFDRTSTFDPFSCLLQCQAQLTEALDGNRGNNAFAASKMSI